jgi:carbon-monoxide dehydrogenase medium subunit
LKPAPFSYQRPETLEEALALLVEHGEDARPLAGGQSLVPMLNFRLATPAVLVDINRLPGLDSISSLDGRLRVGALVRQRALERAPAAAPVGALADGLPLVGHLVTRNRGTVGGSVAHADPAAELPLALLALGGTVEVLGPRRRREIAAADFFTGFLTTALEPGELLVEVRFPAAAEGEGSALVEVAQRHGDFALAAAAAWVRLDSRGTVADARVAVGAVTERPVLVPEAAAAVTGADPSDEMIRSAARVAVATVEPMGSLHAPPDYQRHLTGLLVGRALRRAAERAAA